MDRRRLIEIFDLFELIDQETTPQGVANTFCGCLNRYGFSSCLVTLLHGPHGIHWYKQVIVDGWPKDWLECYQAHEHYKHDPCAKQSRETGKPFLWSEVPIGPNATAAATVMEEAASFGLREGICVPIYAPFDTPAVVSVASAVVDLPQSAIQVVPVLARHAFRALVARCVGLNPARAVLSRRERDVLQWAAAGKTAWETSRILGLSEHTVTTHLKNVRRKLQVTSITHAVVEGARLGEIQL
jgi:LuxR family quorum sensing-dependent transcriptional regulator